MKVSSVKQLKLMNMGIFNCFVDDERIIKKIFTQLKKHFDSNNLIRLYQELQIKGTFFIIWSDTF